MRATKMTQIADSGKMITWQSQKQYSTLRGGCMNEWLASLYDDGVSLERGEHTQDVIKLDHDIIFNENLSPEPKLIFINVKRHFIRFYL